MRYTVLVISIVLYFAILLIIGFLTRRKAGDAADFTIAGREVGMILSTSGITAIAFAGTSIALTPNFAILYGLSGGILFGAVMAIGLAFYALAFGSTFRRCGARTLAEWMEIRFDARTRTLIAIASIMGLCGVLATNVASFAQTLSAYTSWPVWICTAVCFAVILIFTFCSGMHAINMTNLFQMLLGIIALPAFMFILFKMFGGPSYITQNWPLPTNWTSAGIAGSMPVWSLKYPSVFTLVTLMGIFLIWGSNYEFLRITCSRTEKIAKASYCVSSVIQVLFLTLPLCFVGLFAFTSQNQAFASGAVPTTAAFGLMVAQLATAVAAFMLITAMAASVSTASTALMGVTNTAARDVYQRLFHPSATDAAMLLPTRVIMLAVGIFTAILSFFPGGPTYLFAFANSWLGPPAILVLLGIFWKRFTNKAAFWSSLAGMIVLATFTLLEQLGIWSINNVMHVSVAGIAITLVLAIVISLVTEPKYYGAKEWNIDPEKGKRETVELNDDDREVLKMIRDHLDTMVEMVDFMGRDSKFVTASVEKLDRGGFIRRGALTGANFYSFSITEKGLAALEPLTEEEESMRAQALTPLAVAYLEKLCVSEKEGLEYLKEQGITGMKAVSLNSSLDRNGYVSQHGEFTRHFRATDKAREAVKKYAAA